MRLAVVLALVALVPAVANAQAGGFVEQCKPNAAASRAVLAGSVTAEDGQPVAGAAVTLRCGSFRQDARTVGDGSYSIAAPAGSYMVEVAAPGLESRFETIDLAAPALQRDFQLFAGSYSSIVTVTEQGGYVASSSTTATKSDAPLIELPQSVSVVTLDQLTARNVQTVNEAIRYVGSVDVDTYGTESRYDWINIRGFDQSTYGLYRDNSRWQSGSVSGQIDPYLLQEVDIVKGPSSVLYGQNQPGGLVNLVTKRPPSNDLGEVVVNFGSYDRIQAQADIGGPIGEDDSLRYRVTGLWRESDTQVDFVPDDRYFIAPALTWMPNDGTVLTVLGDFQHDDTGWSQFLPSQGTLVSNPHGEIDRSLFVGEPDYDYFDRDQWSIGTLFEHQFGSAWTLRNTMRYSSIEYDGKTVFGGGLQEDLRTLNRFGFGNSLDLALFTADTNASVHATTGSVEHSILVGVDYSASESQIVSGFAFATPLDVFDPVYGAEVPDLFYYFDTTQPVDILGLYAQDHMKIGQHFVASLAARWDGTDITTDDNLSGRKVEQDDSEVTGRVGVTYLSDFGLAPYASYSTSFLPVSGVNFFGAPFDPTEGEQIEGGLKFQPKSWNTFFTASLFEITQTNVSVPDPSNPLNTLQEGEIRSRGFELEAVGHVWQGLSFNAAYSKLDQEVTESSDPNVEGNRPPLAPEELLSIGGDYIITSGMLTGFGFGAGVRYVGDRAGDAANTIEVPSYTLYDASLRYLWRDLEFLVTGTNIADKTYVAVCTSASYCNYGVAQRWVFTVRYDFR